MPNGDATQAIVNGNAPNFGTPQAVQDINLGTGQALAQAGDQAQQQQAQQTPPQQGWRPNIMNLIDAIRGPRSTPGGGLEPARPVSRMDAFEGFVANMLTSLSTGLSQAGHGPGANLRGFGAAVRAPYQRDVGQYQLQQQAAQLESQRQVRESQAGAEQARQGYWQAEAAAQRPSVSILGPDGKPVLGADGKPVLIPSAHVPAVLAAGYRLAGTQYAADQRTAAAQEVAGLRYGQPIAITADLAKQIGLPDALVGKNLSPKTIEELAPKGKVVATGEGVFMADPRTGQPIGQRLGSTPSVTTAGIGARTRIATANIGAQTRITVEGMRDSTQLTRVYNAAGKGAQLIYSKTMDGINRWADNEQKIGYLDFGADPAQARAAFEAERQRRTDAANADLLNRTQDKIGANAPVASQTPTAPTPAAQPRTGFPGAPKNKPAHTQAFAQVIKNDPRLSQVVTSLDKLPNNARKAAIDQGVTEGWMPKEDQAKLYGYYGLK